jgi:uncharacterized membrane protein
MSVQKWAASEKGKAAARRYRATAKGKATVKRANEKRVVATRVIYLPTKDTRDLAHALIQRRRREFVTRQSGGAETESVSAG